MGQDEHGKILIADNDEDVLVALEQALEDEGYDTAVTVSGDLAFQILSTGVFDLLVLDDYLPIDIAFRSSPIFRASE